MGFYDNYVALCNRAGKSPSAVALEMGLTKPTVNRWKNGSQPTDATIRRVADFFGVSVAELKETLTLQDVVYETAKESGLVKAKQLLEAEEEQKKSADQKVSGLVAAGYDDLTPENRAVIDSLIEKLLKSQFGD